MELSLFDNIQRENARVILGIQKDERVILCVANLRPVKGIEYLIKAMRIIVEEIPNVKLVLVGEGPEKARLMDLSEKLDLQNSIVFSGKVSHEEIPVFMAASDVFVLPSLSEGCPMAILEAMASGLPVVATSVGGVPNMVIDGVNGFLVQPANPKDLAQKIMKILKNETVRRTFGELNKKYVQKYSLDNVVSNLLDLYFAIQRYPSIEDTWHS